MTWVRDLKVNILWHKKNLYLVTPTVATEELYLQPPFNLSSIVFCTLLQLYQIHRAISLQNVYCTGTLQKVFKGLNN